MNFYQFYEFSFTYKTNHCFVDILENQENEITFHDNTDKNNDLWHWGLYKTQFSGYIC